MLLPVYDTHRCDSINMQGTLALPMGNCNEMCNPRYIGRYYLVNETMSHMPMKSNLQSTAFLFATFELAHVTRTYTKNGFASDVWYRPVVLNHQSRPSHESFVNEYCIIRRFPL